MRYNEFKDVEEQLNEGPFNAFTSGAKNIAGKAMKWLPSSTAKSIGANWQGQHQFAKLANGLHTEFSQYLGTLGKRIAQGTGDDLVTFLKSKNIPPKGIPAGVLNKQQLNTAMIQAAKDMPEPETAAGSQPAAAGASTTSGSSSVSGSSKTNRSSASTRSSSGSSTMQSKIPKQIKDQIRQLSSAERTQLLGLL